MEWYFHEQTVNSLCNRLMHKCGVDISNNVLHICKALDAGETVDLETISDKAFRKKIRHLCEALCLTPVRETVVPGLPPVAKAFKKPEECHLKLAKVVKQPLLAAVEKELQRQAQARQAESGEDTEVDVAHISEDRMRLQREIMEPINNAFAHVSAPEEPAEEPAEQLACPEEELKGGIMSIDEYREFQQRQEPPARRRPREQEEGAEINQPIKSLMDLRKEGVYKGSTTDVHRYEEMRRHESDLWGKSQREQARHQLKRAKLMEKGQEVDTDEPWERFDRERVFAASRKGASKAQFDELLELTAEHAASFRRA
eukprot:Protomagalhaensia_sp_Gyna_25__1651@NODE_1858_length_1466_cov_8_545900_g1527_i0_p1_GENE_NODE_1858_length_1466_cov_8_545900_g1527_i0NODE_1858_length_1466_cov_8_545900_g1527_i0_p1_ORF_typecomplete_len314_score63_83DUF3752/PF12572_8/16_NODE_1858_length_1466_cov_8_545900_g1527_i01321073